MLLGPDRFNELFQTDDKDLQDENGDTLLVKAVSLGEPEICESLIQAGLNLGIVDRHGNTLLTRCKQRIKTLEQCVWSESGSNKKALLQKEIDNMVEIKAILERNSGKCIIL